MLASGTVIQSDLFIPCYPRGPNTSFLSARMLDEQRYVNVDDYLRSTVGGNHLRRVTLSA